jgi:phage tail sheath protein FI
LLPEKTHEDAIAAVTDVGDSNGFLPLTDGTDGTMPNPIDGGPETWNQEGPEAIVGAMALLDRIAPDIFNLMCIPAATTFNDAGYTTVLGKATGFCRDRRAFFLADVPGTEGLDSVLQWLTDHDNLRSDHSALYFPRVRITDPKNENRPREVGSSGTLAGIYARTDAQRGVWKAPAGTDAVLRGIVELAHKLTDLENGGLNVNGINVLRSFPIFGPVSWGARTLDGADQKTSEYKYIPVRRTALYIEESLCQGLKWVVFEPNDEPLWSQIRLNVGAFMNNLFRLGAFQGATARQAYFVRCDKDTTTQNDIDRGVVNIVVGFAPLKPAEFVVIKVQQIAGQIAA